MLRREVPPGQGRQRRRDEFDLAQALHGLQDVPPAGTRRRARSGTAADVELVGEEVRVPAREEGEQDLVEATFVVVTRRGCEADRKVIQERGDIAQLEVAGRDRRRRGDEERFEFEGTERLAAAGGGGPRSEFGVSRRTSALREKRVCTYLMCSCGNMEGSWSTSPMYDTKSALTWDRPASRFCASAASESCLDHSQRNQRKGKSPGGVSGCECVTVVRTSAPFSQRL